MRVTPWFAAQKQGGSGVQGETWPPAPQRRKEQFEFFSGHLLFGVIGGPALEGVFSAVDGAGISED